MLLIVCLSISWVPSHALTNAPADSVGVEKKGSKNFILHKVDAKETLYSISRKYDVSVAQLQESNADIKTGISIGQIIRIPYKTPSVKTAVLSSKTHIVASKETLFSISKKYNVSMEELKRANPGLAGGVKKGQELVIPSKENAKPKLGKQDKETTEAVRAKKTEPNETAKEDSKESQKPAKEEKEQEEDNKVKKDNSTTPSKSLAISSPPATVSSSYKKISESGFANLMENSPADLKYLALHKNAPVGTIIQVRNDENNQKIFVRVSGKLAATTDKVILKISPKAFERLGAKGEKIPVSISYIP